MDQRINEIALAVLALIGYPSIDDSITSKCQLLEENIEQVDVFLNNVGCSAVEKAEVMLYIVDNFIIKNSNLSFHLLAEDVFVVNLVKRLVEYFKRIFPNEDLLVDYSLKLFELFNKVQVKTSNVSIEFVFSSAPSNIYYAVLLPLLDRKHPAEMFETGKSFLEKLYSFEKTEDHFFLTLVTNFTAFSLILMKQLAFHSMEYVKQLREYIAEKEEEGLPKEVLEKFDKLAVKFSSSKPELYALLYEEYEE